MSFTIGRMRQAERQLADAIARQASALHRGAMRSLLLTAAIAAAVLIVVLLATVVIARSLVRPLRQLKAGALEVAGVRLPEEVRELSTAGETGQSGEVEPIGVHSTDEIGQVARAFDQVHQEAVRLAADEARLRGSVSAMFISLSRRSGSLLERLLRLIDSLELGEQDSERLADLFRMDHLATRMRRNSENLLVLAGQEPPRRWAEPVSLADVARASVSEIEQYERVLLDLQPGLGVTGNAVADVVHLLAEIIENATTFSQRSSHVTVSGHSLRSGGVLINVVDSGMGMTEEQLAVVNWRLENPPAADVEVSRHMGLFAVAHLADRNGIRVRLRKATGAGLIAHVWLPEALISHDSKPTSWDRIRTERASAVVQAVTRAARFSQDPAAAVALAAAPFAAAPLADAPLTTSRGEAPAATAPATIAPAAEAPATAAPPGETPATAAPPGEAPVAAELPGEAPAAGAPAVTAPAAEAPGGPQAGAQQVVVPEPLQRPREIRLPIFESVESDWFRARRRPPPRAGVRLDPHRVAPSWTSPSDEGWRAAETVLAPAVGGVTAAGLPRRTPKANLVPGSAGAQENRPAGAADSAEAISSRLAGFQRGSRRARATAASAQSSDEQP
jgi:signal transduction histidine kinase